MKLIQNRSIATLAAALGIVAGPSSLNAGTCSINGNTTYQTIDGFGFSTAWCGALSSAKNAALYDTLGFSLLRVRIDENNSWSDETANANAAHARGLSVLGCAWRWPSSMSTGTAVPYSLSTSKYGSYCTWLGSACTSIGLNYVSIKNEPDMPSSSDGNLTGAQIHDILAAGVSIGRPIAIADAVGFSDSITDPALNDTATLARVTVVSGHLYGNGNYIHWNGYNKGKKIWMTEHYVANSRDNINLAVSQAYEISQCLDNLMSAYFYWWVNDNDTSVDLANTSGLIYKAGYVGGQFAKYVRPGKIRIGCTTYPTANIAVNAFRSGGLVIVAVNNGSSAVSGRTMTLSGSFTS